MKAAIKYRVFNSLMEIETKVKNNVRPPSLKS